MLSGETNGPLLPSQTLGHKINTSSSSRMNIDPKFLIWFLFWNERIFYDPSFKRNEMFCSDWICWKWVSLQGRVIFQLLSFLWAAVMRQYARLHVHVVLAETLGYVIIQNLLWNCSFPLKARTTVLKHEITCLGY